VRLTLEFSAAAFVGVQPLEMDALEWHPQQEVDV